MISKATSRFWRHYRELPEEIRLVAKKAYSVFKNDPWYPSLHFKPVHSGLPVYSIRIAIDYRAVGILQNGKVIWFWVGSHSDYDKLLSSLKKSG